jgi:putative PIN family toxin of toxin-antitoxin system
MSGRAPYELIVCPRLIGEIREVLDRPRLRKRISAEDASDFLETISMLPNQVADPSEIASVTRDADDDYLVALAREHEAAWIVTGDDDLLEWEEQSPRTIAPAAFEQWLSERLGPEEATDYGQGITP